jgi:hypothetical protein
MSLQEVKEEFLPKLITAGEQRFYRFLLVFALNKLVSIENDDFKEEPPNLQFLTYHDQAIILYRREGEDIYLHLARLFRKAAHHIYRVMLKKKMTDINSRFLNAVP